MNDSDLPSIENFIVDSVYLPISEGDSHINRIREVGHGEFAPDEIVAFVKKKNLKLYYLDLASGNYIDSIALDKYANIFGDFYPIDTNVVLLALLDNSIIKINDQSPKKWNMNPITQAIGKYVYIGNLSAYSLDMFGDTVMCLTTTSEPRKKAGPNIPFLLANYDIIFRLHPDTVQSITSFNLNPSYFLKQDYNSRHEQVY